MWVKAEGGMLVNLDHVESINIESDDGPRFFKVNALYGENERVELFKGSHADACKFHGRIVRWLIHEKKLI